MICRGVAVTATQAASTLAAASAPAARPPRGVLPVTCLALATVVAAVASLNVALPSIARETHASSSQLSWIVDAYSLVFAGLLLLGGAIGDRFGRRRALLVGLGIFGAGSIVAMTSADPGLLIAMRAVLGAGAALVMPATLATITSTFPAAQRAKAVSIWAGVAGGSALLGLLTSGLVLEQWSWRAVFVINVVLAVIAFVATLRVVPESADPDAPRLDVTGAVISTVGLSVIVYALIEAPTTGWASAQTLLELGGGLLVLALFVGYELRRPVPLLDPRLFRLRGFTAGTVSLTVQFFAFFGFIFLVLQYLQLVRGDSPLIAALSMTPMVFGMMPAARGAARAVERFSVRSICVLGLLIALGAFVGLAQLDASTPYWVMVCCIVPLGAGMGLAMTPATSVVTDSLPDDQQGVGSAVNDLTRELGGALGIAVIGSVLASTYRSHLHLTGLPQQAVSAARSSLAQAAHLGPQVAAQAQDAFVAGMHAALLTGAGALALAAIVVATVLSRRR
jgi:EmrB/QacA subfamily drug resistance transporter